jgi:hypothetical protein
MEIYDPTDDIINFRDYRLPWVGVDGPDRAFHSCSLAEHALEGETVRPIAHNATDGLVLLYMPNSGWPLAICRSDSPDGDYGELLHYYENIWAFEHDEQSAVPPATD